MKASIPIPDEPAEKHTARDGDVNKAAGERKELRHRGRDASYSDRLADGYRMMELGGDEG